MVDILNLYLDDSGTRHPDKKQGKKPIHGYDYFSLGGVLIDECNKSIYEQKHISFCKKWNISAPLHSSEIRNKSGGFSFIGMLSEKDRELFYEELYQLMAQAPVKGVACVVDRPAYKNRYDDIYGENKWKLCKTAFSIVVERSAKIAIKENKKLRVNIERCNKKEDQISRAYYDEIRTQGMPFDDDSSLKYDPVGSTIFEEVLYDFKTKFKSSKLTQLADLYLWPMCIGGYDQNNKPYKRLLEDKKLIDCFLNEEEKKSLGIKYSCWELVDRKDKVQQMLDSKSAI